MNQGRKIRVAVVFGGQSPEHAISCAGGGAMLAAIDRDRYDVIGVGILPDGRWVLTADEPERLAIAGGEMPSVESVAGPGTRTLPWAAQAAPAPGAGDVTVPGALTTAEPGAIPRELSEVDVVLPILHGPFGEDGTIQGLLELAGIRYVGAGVLASAVSMDKEYMKLIFMARGLPVGPFVVVRDRDWQPSPGGGASPSAAEVRKPVLDAIAELGWPVFVKPARGGSSIGTSKATDLARDRQALRPEGARRESHRGPGNRVRRARGAGRGAARHQRAWAVAGRWGRGLLGLRGEVPGRGERDGDPGPHPR